MARLSSVQWECLIKFMRNHVKFARGLYEGHSGKKNQRNLWEELTNQLNTLGHGTKSVKQWQKTWADIKYNIKKKYVIAKTELESVGGGHPTLSVFNHWERKVIHILGRSFQGSDDDGDNYTVTTSSKYKEEACLVFDSKVLQDIPELLPTSTKKYNKKDIISINDTINCNSVNVKELPQHVLDHSYVPPTDDNSDNNNNNKRKRTESPPDGKELFQERTELLKDIRDSMSEMAVALKGIFTEMREIKGLLLEKK